MGKRSRSSLGSNSITCWSVMRSVSTPRGMQCPQPKKRQGHSDSLNAGSSTSIHLNRSAPVRRVLYCMQPAGNRSLPEFDHPAWQSLLSAYTQERQNIARHSCVTTICGVSSDFIAGASWIMNQPSCDHSCQHHLLNVVCLQVVLGHFFVGMRTYPVVLIGYCLTYTLKFVCPSVSL